jgi:REP element-mobilizing transposase RayT
LARPLRIEFPDAFYHVTSRGNERKTVFRSQKDRERFLSYLESAHYRYGAILHVYCLMDNHYHLLVETPRGNLSQILHHINGAYTTYFNIKHGRSGHLFQGRFKAILVEKDSYGEELSKYIHLNPVRAGLVKNTSEYRWSSYRYYIGMEREPEWLTTTFILSYFGGHGRSTYRKYREFVEEGISKASENPLRKVVASTFLGGEEFIRRIGEEQLEGRKIDRRNVPSVKKVLRGPTPGEIEAVVSKVIKENAAFYRKWCIHLSHQWSGWRLEEIGAYFGMRGAAVSQMSRRFRKTVERDRSMGKLLERLKKELLIVET